MEIRRLTGHTGAEVVGIDLRHGVSAETRAALNAAFVERSVLVVRDQALTPGQMLAAVELLGLVFPAAQHTPSRCRTVRRFITSPIRIGFRTGHGIFRVRDGTPTIPTTRGRRRRQFCMR